MNKKLLYIGITLVIVGIIIAPVSGIVTPPTTFKDIFFKGIWTAIMDLQKQITALTTKVNTIPAGQACWDLNNNNKCDIASEDKNSDGLCTVTDCQGPAGTAGKDGNPGTTVTVFSSSAVSGTKVDPLPGYTIQQCKIIASPFRADCQHTDYPVLRTVESFVHTDPITFERTVHTGSICWKKDYSDFEFDEGIANYMIICTK